MKILVTGATGFLASHLMPALRARGDRVVALVRDLVAEATLDPKSVHAIVRGRVQDYDVIARVLAEYEIDLVFHLAAQTQVSVAIAEPVGTFETNIQGTWTVLEACRKAGTRRVVVASSDKAYGAGDVPYSEDVNPTNGGAPYETSKAVQDMLAQTYARSYGMSVGITRCGNLYGPGHVNFSTLIPGTIRRIINGEAPQIRGDGSAKRDFLFVADAVDAYLRLADSNEVGAFNVGTGKPSSIVNVVSAILKAMKSKLVPIHTEETKHEIRDQWLHSEKARERLKWTAKHDLAQGLRKTIPWYLGHVEKGKPCDSSD